MGITVPGAGMPEGEAPAATGAQRQRGPPKLLPSVGGGGICDSYGQEQGVVSYPDLSFPSPSALLPWFPLARPS